jgi:hypothetical protein
MFTVVLDHFDVLKKMVMYLSTKIDDLNDELGQF